MSQRLVFVSSLALAAVAVAGLAGVVTAEPPPAITAHARYQPTPAPVPMADSGAALFAANCVTCHGPTGGGDGPAAVGLNPKPRQLSSAAVMTKISDERIATVVKTGGAANKLSPLMPAFTQFTDAQVKALVAHVRSLCGCSYKP